MIEIVTFSRKGRIKCLYYFLIQAVGRNIQQPLDLELDDELITSRSKSLPRQSRKDFYMEDDIRTGAIPKRERSPRFDLERAYRQDCYDSRDYRSSRDIFNIKDFMLDIDEFRNDRRQKLDKDLDLRKDANEAAERRNRLVSRLCLFAYDK